jgi:DnaJ-class molecular chaperone
MNNNDWVTCPACKGTGIVEGFYRSERFECGACNGNGVVRASRVCKHCKHFHTTCLCLDRVLQAKIDERTNEWRWKLWMNK